jgi:hypothetical protein
MKSEERDPLDNLLNEALREYSSREPRPGLEQRVLHRIHAAGPPRRFPRWVFAIPALACIVLLAAIFWSRRVPKLRPIEVAHAVVKTSAPEVPPAPPEPPRHIVWGRTRYPKQPQFPAPTPLTPEERALLTLVKRAPKEAREVLAEARSQTPEPIRIDKIEIPPLQSDGLN